MIQKFNNFRTFPETLQGNFNTICPGFESSVTFILVESNVKRPKFNYVLFSINKQIPLGKELAESKAFQIQTSTYDNN